MRIVIISAPARRKPVPDYVSALQKGMASMGHQVDIMDAWSQDGYRLSAYEYIVVTAETVSPWGSKIPEVLPKMLTFGSGLVGKKSAAFLKKTGLFTAKALSNLMRSLEKEGMPVNWSEVILNAPHAEALGKHIGA